MSNYKDKRFNYKHLDTPKEARERLERERNKVVNQHYSRYVRHAKRTRIIGHPIELIYRLAEYFYRQDERGKPYTEKGVKRVTHPKMYNIYKNGGREKEAREYYLGFLVDPVYEERMKRYEGMDDIAPYLAYFIDSEEDTLGYQEIIEKAELLVAEQREERLYERGNSGDVFSMKARNEWSDKEPERREAFLHGVDPEKAIKYIEMEPEKVETEK